MESKAYFNKVADQWDEIRKGFFSDTLREKAYLAAGIQNNRVAADIGAGSGFMTEGLIKNGIKVIAVDQSEEMLKRIQEKFGIEKVDCRLGDANCLPIKEAEVDYAFANMFLHHVTSPPTAIQEMARVVKPGGKLVITDLDEHNFEFLRIEQFDRWLGFNQEDIRNWFHGAGLKNIRVECLGENCCSDSACGPEKAQVSIFVAYGEK